jgi:hypothetical protein
LERAEPWQLVLTADEINAWLTTELATKLPHALPPDVSHPRVAIIDKTIYFACQHKQVFGGVLSIALVPELTDRHNEVAVRVQSFSLGRLPLPQKQYLDEVSRAAARAGVNLQWKEEAGAAVALITVPDRIESLRNRVVTVKSLAVREGEIVVEGTSEREVQTAQVRPRR